MDRWRGLGIPLDVLDQAGALAWIEDAITAGRHGWIATPNPEIAVAAWRTPALAAALNHADLCLADGIGMLWASRTLGGPLQERVPGIELLEQALALCARHGWPVYFLGAKPGIAAAAGRHAAARWPGLQVAGTAHGYFTAAESAAVVRDILAAGPRLLAVGMGHPRQEVWLAEHSPRLSGIIGIACGGSLDVLAGEVTRAPEWFRRRNLEWLYRIAAAPRARLGRSGALLDFATRVMAVRLGLAPRLE